MNSVSDIVHWYISLQVILLMAWQVVTNINKHYSTFFWTITTADGVKPETTKPVTIERSDFVPFNTRLLKHFAISNIHAPLGIKTIDADRSSDNDTDKYHDL